MQGFGFSLPLTLITPATGAIFCYLCYLQQWTRITLPDMDIGKLCTILASCFFNTAKWFDLILTSLVQLLRVLEMQRKLPSREFSLADRLCSWTLVVVTALGQQSYLVTKKRTIGKGRTVVRSSTVLWNHVGTVTDAQQKKKWSRGYSENEESQTWYHSRRQCFHCR